MQKNEMTYNCKKFIEALGMSKDFEILKSDKAIEKIVADVIKKNEKDETHESFKASANSIPEDPIIKLDNGSIVYIRDLCVFGMSVARVLYMLKIELEKKRNMELAKEAKYYANKLILVELSKIMKKVVDKYVECEN